MPRSWLSRQAIGLLPTRIASRPSADGRCASFRHHGVRTAREPSERTAKALAAIRRSDPIAVIAQ